MTYRIERSQFIENGPTITAAAAVARVRKAAIYAAFDRRKAGDRCTELSKAA